MSAFASLCFDEHHKDPIDVAYSFSTGEVRLLVWKDDDENSTTTILDSEQATHMVALMNEAIYRATGGEVR